MDASTIFGSSKITHHQDRLGSYLAGSRSLIPITVEMDLTNICSHRCPLCIGRRTEGAEREQLFAVSGDGESMDGERAADYIRQMAECGVRGLMFTGGGEPTVHPDLDKLVILARRYGLDVGLITHGGLLHRHNIDALVAACTWIRVSIDAATPEEFVKTHGRGEHEWRRVWGNISLLTEAARICVASATIGIGYLTSPDNASGLLECARLGKLHGVDYIQARPFHRWSAFDVTPYLQEANRQYGSSGFQVIGSTQKYRRIHDGAIEGRSYGYCHFSNFASAIGANEKVYVCCHLKNIEQFCVGDLREQTFLEIMQSQKRAQVNGSVEVGKCQPLCRGDHVNREVQELIQIGSNSPAGEAPAHVNFL